MQKNNLSLTKQTLSTYARLFVRSAGMLNFILPGCVISLIKIQVTIPSCATSFAYYFGLLPSHPSAEKYKETNISANQKNRPIGEKRRKSNACALRNTRN
jgi:hypothetical protein